MKTVETLANIEQKQNRILTELRTANSICHLINLQVLELQKTVSNLIALTTKANQPNITK
jgi:hypothetical protein